MAVNKRWSMKKICDQVINNIERAQGDLENLMYEYHEVHPEIAQVFLTVHEGLEIFKPVMQKQRDEI